MDIGLTERPLCSLLLPLSLFTRISARVKNKKKVVFFLFPLIFSSPHLLYAHVRIFTDMKAI